MFRLVDGDRRPFPDLEEKVKGWWRSQHVPDVMSLNFTGDDALDGPGGAGGSVVDQAESSSDAEWRRHRFRVMYNANRDDLWRYCLRRASTIEEAEEALAETFAVAWRRFDIVPKGDDARPWLFGVARNELRSGWRKNKRSRELNDRLVHAHGERHTPDPADDVVGQPSAILAAMATLREKDQEMLRLAAWEELPHAQIAQLVGCSENAVAIRVHRARGRLAKAMEKQAKSSMNRVNREKVKAAEISAHVGSNSPTPTTGSEA